MSAKLFIPKKIKVGYQERSGTFTGKLAYVIYYDEKGVLRKEKSWEGWRDSNIEPQEFDNTPMPGFIFNKGIQRFAEWYGSGRTVFRLYAPHDFEFEINGDNLINLLMHSDVSKREILEPCVFAWSGTELILLPTNSVEYQESVQYTERQSLKVSTKELVPGHQYSRKKQDGTLTYIGRLDWWSFTNNSGKKYSSGKGDFRYHKNTGKKHIFYNESTKSFEALGAAVLSHEINDQVVENYAYLVDEFYKLYVSQPITGCKVVPRIPEPVTTEHWYNEHYPTMYMFDTETSQLRTISVSYHGRWTLDPETHRGRYVYDNFARAYLTETIDNLSFEPSLITKSIQVGCERNRWQGQGRYLYNYQQDKPELHISIKKQCAIDGIDYEDLTATQYVDIMNKIGYGFPHYILQNGTEIDYKTSYYY